VGTGRYSCARVRGLEPYADTQSSASEAPSVVLGDMGVGGLPEATRRKRAD